MINVQYLQMPSTSAIESTNSPVFCSTATTSSLSKVHISHGWILWGRGGGGAGQFFLNNIFFSDVSPTRIFFVPVPCISFA